MLNVTSVLGILMLCELKVSCVNVEKRSDIL